MSATFCTVCKFEQFFEDQKSTSGRKKRWIFTSERTSVSQVQIIFKLYEILKQEFLVGSVCNECFDLIDQIDSLEFQVQAVTKALKSRVDLASKVEEADHEDDETELSSSRLRKRRRRKLSVTDRRRNRDVGDADWDSDSGNDDAKNASFKRSTTKQKRSKNSAHMNAESKRPRFEDEDENSVDENDPIDVNKFLASDGIRIKEERNFDESFGDYDQYPSGDGDAGMSLAAKKFWDMVADPRIIERALDTENIDYNVTMAQTTRGQEQLVYEGYTYKKYSYQDKQERVVKWKCSNYYAKKGKCPAKIATTPDGCCVLLDSKMDHNHEPDQSAIKIIMFRDRVKEMAVNHPDMKASEILANVEMLMDNPGPLGLKDESLMRYVQRVRSKQAKGEMGFKKVTYNRKKGFRWGLSASSAVTETSPDKKSAINANFGSGDDFQANFLDHDRDDRRLSGDLKCSDLDSQHFADLSETEMRTHDSLVHDSSVADSSYRVASS